MALLLTSKEGCPNELGCRCAVGVWIWELDAGVDTEVVDVDNKCGARVCMVWMCRVAEGWFVAQDGCKGHGDGVGDDGDGWHGVEIVEVHVVEIGADDVGKSCDGGAKARDRVLYTCETRCDEKREISHAVRDEHGCALEARNVPGQQVGCVHGDGQV